MFTCNTIMAEENDESVNISHIYVVYGEGDTASDPVDVSSETLEIESGLVKKLSFNVEATGIKAGTRYNIYQYNEKTHFTKQLCSSTSSRFTLKASDFTANEIVYLTLSQNNKNYYIRPLVIRVNPGAADTQFDKQIGSGTEPVNIPLNNLFPGMNFSMDPYILPAKVQVFEDGRIVLGLGYNSSNADFWENAVNGTLIESTDIKELSDVFWGDSKNKSATKNSNLDVSYEIAGWLEGNLNNKDEPLKGEISMFIGSGFDVTGQYTILTWEVTFAGGAGGYFVFKLKPTSAGKYTIFEPDDFYLFVQASLELYGGIGLSSLISAGIYGGGSLRGDIQLHPTAELKDLILSGETGFKVKLFSRTLFSYALISGSKQIYPNNDILNSEYLLMNNLQYVDQYLLANNYAQAIGTIHEPSTDPTWYNSSTLRVDENTDLNGYETDADFDHVIAENVYPENKLQVVKTGSNAFPQMNIVFLGSDTGRTEGNRSRLQNFYFSEYDNFISDPAWMFPDATDNTDETNGYYDDGTADYDPYVFHSDIETYIVWRNANSVIQADASFEDIAENSDIYFARFQAGNSWTGAEQVTSYAGSNNFAADAKVGADDEGKPVITYYECPISDPADFDVSDSHDVYFARKEGNDWVHTNAFTITGAISNLENAWFNNRESIAVSYKCKDNNNNDVYRIELWQETSGEWKRVYAKDNAANAIFGYNGQGDALLTWYSDGDFYTYDSVNGERKLIDSSNKDKDIKVPSSDYRIYGTFNSGQVALVGVGSKDSQANAYAIVSNDGGNKWTKAYLTQIGENSLVNGISIGFTSLKEPVTFYSVQNYVINEDASFEGSNLTNDQHGLNGTVLLGDDDQRFEDGTVDIYAKGRNANQNFEIVGYDFKEEDDAISGQTTPLTITVENTGLLDINSLSVEYGGKLIGTSPSIKTGEKAEIVVNMTVPDQDRDDTYTYENIEISDGIHTSKSLNATLGTGSVSVDWSHQYVISNGGSGTTGREELTYAISNNGFNDKTFVAVSYDADTKQYIHDAPLFVQAHEINVGSITPDLSMFALDGNNNITTYLLTIQELNKLQDGAGAFVSSMDLDEFIENLELYINNISGDNSLTADSKPKQVSNARSYSFASLPEKLSQNFSELFNVRVDDNEPAPGSNDSFDDEIVETVTSGYRPEPTDEEKPVESDKKEDVEPSDDTKPEETYPEPPEECIEENTGTNIVPYLVAGSLLMCAILLIVVFIRLRKDDDE